MTEPTTSSSTDSHHTLRPRRWFPHATLSLFMWVLWLLLVNSINPGHIGLGAFLAWFIPWSVQSFWPETLRIEKPLLLVRYIIIVLWDIVVANLILARRILGPVDRLKPTFIKMPIELEHQFTITILVSSISLTPGTVAADLNVEEGYLLIHAIHEGDVEAAVAHLKARYEAPLKEIFGC